MKTFHLEILTPEQPFFIGECLSLSVPVSDGMLGIMAGHSPLTVALHDGCVVYECPDGTNTVCAVSRGMLVFDKQGARLLCDDAALPENIDEERERRNLEEAEFALREKRSHEDYVVNRLTVIKSLNNLKIKHHNENAN